MRRTPVGRSSRRPAPAVAAGTVTEVAASQAGHSAGAYRNAYVLATDTLTDTTFQVRSGGAVIGSGTLVDEGVTGGRRVHSADFSTIPGTGVTVTYRYTTRLPVGRHSYHFRTTDTTTNPVKTVNWTGPTVN